MGASKPERAARRADLHQGGRRAPRPAEEMASYGAALEVNLKAELRESRRPLLRKESAPATEASEEESRVPAVSLKRGVAVIEGVLRSLPEAPGCYRMLGAEGEALYVGMARNLRKRVAAYTRPERQPHRIARMVSLVRSMEIVETATEVEALLLETNLIKRLEPKFNVLLRDDKSYPYILIHRGHEFPRLMRHRGARKAEGHYFGPFASVGSVRNSLAALERGFLLRSCSDSVFANRSRPCLLYDLKRCSAPCTGKISAQDYAGLVEQARRTLDGDDKPIRERLLAEMRTASEAQEYERAARLRDRLRGLAAITTDQAINLAEAADADLFALARSGAHACVQVFFFRGGRNYGNRAFFPRGCEDLSDARLLASFIPLFYAKAPPPPEVLASAPPGRRRPHRAGPLRARRAFSDAPRAPPGGEAHGLGSGAAQRGVGLGAAHREQGRRRPP